LSLPAYASCPVEGAVHRRSTRLADPEEMGHSRGAVDLVPTNAGVSPAYDWRHVMPPNWDLIQHLNADKHIEWPTGPITGVSQGFVPTWVEAWVVQGGEMTADAIWPGPTQTGTQSSWSGFVPGRWTASEPGWRHGKFEPGPAMGIALLTLRNPSTKEVQYDWWFELVILQE
jgi:hypothetical protein